MRPCVKVCGVTRSEDARLAAQLGATHLGCVMVPRSPRYVTPAQAKRVVDAAREELKLVLIFKGEPPKTVERLAREVGTTHVQLFGFSENEALALERERLTVYRVHEIEPEDTSLPALDPEPSDERPAVLDVRGGGSGRTFRWEILGERAPHATFIAGGIRPENIRRLLEHHPYGVDLSSGVESEPGIKDPRKMALFFRNLEESL